MKNQSGALNKKIIVIGAGIGGLGAGYWLSKKGYDVEILEATDRPGGRMQTNERNGDKFEVGALFYHSHYHHAEELMKIVSLDKTKLTIHGDMMIKLKDGSNIQIDHRKPYFKPLGLRGNLKMAGFMVKEILLKKQDPLNKIINVRPEWDDVCIKDYWNSASKTDQALRDILVNMISVTTNDGWPEYLNLSHFVHCVRIDVFTSFYALKGGTSSLTTELAKLLNVRYENPVSQLVMEKNRVVGVQMESNGEVKRADHVIVAAAPPFVSKLIPQGKLEAQAKLFDQVLLNPYPVAVFFLDRALDKNVWAYINELSKRPTFTWAIDNWAKTPESVPSGKSILTVNSAHPVTHELIKKSDEEILKIAQDDLENFIPGFNKNIIEDAALHRHNHSVARYPVGSYKLATEIKAKSFENGVSFITDFTGGGYIEAALDSARDAVDRICESGC